MDKKRPVLDEDSYLQQFHHFNKYLVDDYPHVNYWDLPPVSNKMQGFARGGSAIEQIRKRKP